MLAPTEVPALPISIACGELTVMPIIRPDRDAGETTPQLAVWVGLTMKLVDVEVTVVVVAFSVSRVEMSVVVAGRTTTVVTARVTVDVEVEMEVAVRVSWIVEVEVDAAASVAVETLLTALMQAHAEKYWAESVHGGAEDEGASDEVTTASLDEVAVSVDEGTSALDVIVITTSLDEGSVLEETEEVLGLQPPLRCSLLFCFSRLLF